MKPSTGAPPGLAEPDIGPIVNALPPRTILTSSIAMTGKEAIIREAMFG